MQGKYYKQRDYEKEYRDNYELCEFSTCECGHISADHNFILWRITECKECQCPKFKWVGQYTSSEIDAFQKSLLCNMMSDVEDKCPK